MAETPDSFEELTRANAIRARDSLRLGLTKLSTWDEKNRNRHNRSAISEIVRRYVRLVREFENLVDINRYLMDEEKSLVHFDETSGVLATSKFGLTIRLKIEKKDPSIPLQMTPLTSVYAYQADQHDDISQEGETLRFDLENKIESFYNNAHRIQKSLQRTFNVKRKDCRSVTLVRNHLIEHKEEDVGYSFRVGPSGPRVQPSRPSNIDIHNDDGLFSNAHEFG